MTRAEAFLGRRKTTSPAKFDKHVRRKLADWQEFRVRTALGLLRSIVIEPKDVESR